MRAWGARLGQVESAGAPGEPRSAGAARTGLASAAQAEYRCAAIVRPRRMVVGPVLIAALALVALPGLAGSRAPSAVEPLPAGAFQPLSILASDARSTKSTAALDGGYLSAGVVHDTSTFIEPSDLPETEPPSRARINQPDPGAASVRKPAKYTLRGEATFYDNGTTAMRLPRGTVVIICGGGGCVERVVNDYGPQKPSRIVDLYRPDFFDVCGCASWSGVVDVTVYVY